MIGSRRQARSGPGGGRDRARSQPGEICFRGVLKRYPGREQPAVQDLTFEIGPGEICVLIGPSGCGKTTALKMVNRLISITAGEITIDGRSVEGMGLTDLRRGIGYVFQQIGLFPHLTVEANIGAVPRLLGWSKAEIHARAAELLELVGLDPNGDLRRYPGEFSGGQQQRIGVARAMAADPPIMLMDEPFGAIDPIARERLQNDFLRLHREVKKTVIFVTHDIDEAIKMGDRIAIMRGGRLVQVASGDELLAQPADEFVASFVGEDRGLKRLRVRTLRDARLDDGDGLDPHDPELVTLDASLHLALSRMLSSGRSRLGVVDEHGTFVGGVSLRTITDMVGPARVAAEAQPVARGDG